MRMFLGRRGGDRRRAAAQAGEAPAGPSPPASEETRASEVVKTPELDDFPLEQSRDETLKNAFDRVRSVDSFSSRTSPSPSPIFPL